MNQKLAVVGRIIDVKSIEGADRIEACRMTPEEGDIDPDNPDAEAKSAIGICNPRTNESRVDVSDVQERISYNRGTGELTWKKNVGQRARTGMPCGSIHSSGYVHVKINRISLKAHRVAWLLAHGAWPEQQIDHINGDKSDNRLSNLREASSSQNRWNSKRPINNTTGFAGVVVDARRGGWPAQIRVNKKSIYLGNFNSPEAASAAYEVAATKYFSDFYSGGRA